MDDYIEITDEDGNVLEKELVTIFKINSSDNSYVIYRDPEQFYIAKFLGTDIHNLDTDLSKEELTQCKLKIKEAFINEVAGEI